MTVRAHAKLADHVGGRRRAGAGERARRAAARGQGRRTRSRRSGTRPSWPTRCIAGSSPTTASPGTPSAQVAVAMELRAKELGADGLSFPPIVAAADNGALPHAEPRADPPIPRDTLVVVDFGVVERRPTARTARARSRPATSTTRQPSATSWCARRRPPRWRRCAPAPTCRAVDAVARELIAAAGPGGAVRSRPRPRRGPRGPRGTAPGALGRGRARDRQRRDRRARRLRARAASGCGSRTSWSSAPRARRS